MNKCKDMVLKWISPRNLAILTSLFYGVTLLPVLILGFFNFPSADDFSMGSRCHVAWMETGSVLAVLGNAIGHAIDDWFHWVGYFTSDFLMAMPLSTFGENAYVWTTVLMLIFLNIGVYHFFYSVFVKLFGCDRFSTHSVIMLFLFVCVQCMCQAGRCESIYWYCGVSNYIMMHAVELFFYGCMINVLINTGKLSVWKKILLSVLAFLLGGANQMTALNMVIIHMAVIVVSCIVKKQWILKKIWLYMTCNLIGFLLNCFAPGNFVRAEQTSMMNPVKAIFISLYYGLERMFSEWTDWTIVVILIMMIPLFLYMFRSVRFSFPCPILFVVFAMGCAAAMVTPPIFVTGNMEAGRIQGLAYMMYVLMLTLSVAYVTGWVRNKMKKEDSDQQNYSENSKLCMIGCMGMLLFGSVLMMIPEHHYYTYSSALTELCNGNAIQYRKEQLKRFSDIEEAIEQGEQTIYLEAFSVHPQLLFYMDITDDPDIWPNTGLSRYYNTDAKFVLIQD